MSSGQAPLKAETSSEADRENAPESERPKEARAWATFGPLALCLILAGLLLRATWLKWADVLVDFGRELYVPWRLTEGEVLYRDLAYFNGPLSPYLNSLVFRVFGVSFLGLSLFNIALLSLFCAFAWRTLRNLSGPFSAGLCLLFALPVFFFGHHVGIANYNFVSPYSHEMTHGLFLAAGSVACALAWLNSSKANGNTTWLVLSGLLAGLTFLTKAEMFVANVAGLGVVALGVLVPKGSSTQSEGIAQSNPAPSKLKALAVFAACFIVAPLVAFLCLSIALPSSGALRGVLGSWPGVFEDQTRDLLFYKFGMGTDRPGHNFGLQWQSLGFLALFFGTGCLLARLLPGSLNKTARLAAALGVALVSALCWHFTTPQAGPAGQAWHSMARPLPLALVLIALVEVVSYWRQRSQADQGPATNLNLARLTWTAFALALLAKMILNVRFEHYGFALALPAAWVLSLAGLCWWPSRLQRNGWVLQATTIGLMAAAAWSYWQKSQPILAAKVHEVGRGGDRMLTDARGLFVSAALNQIEQNNPAGEDELLVLPEGITMNYWARKRTPSSFLNFMPPELLLFGEENILSAFQANPPACIALVHKDTSEYGFPLFGQHYGQSLMAWAQQNYRGLWKDDRGGPPLQAGTPFGLGLLVPKPKK